MNYKDSVKNALLLYPCLYKSRLDVDEHLFAVLGNGYSWENGELVSSDDTHKVSKMDGVLKSIKGRITDNYYELQTIGWCLENGKDKYKLSSSDVVDVVKYIVGDVLKNITDEVKCIKSVDSSYKKYEHVPYKWEREKWKIYPICAHSDLVVFPDDIKPDWAKALYKFVCWCLEHTEYLDDECEFDKQIEYLNESKKRLEKIIYGNI